MTCTTIIEDEPQALEPPRQQWATHHLSAVIEASPTSNGMRTPRAMTFKINAPNNNNQEFDDLYDMTDNEVEEVPIRISTSFEPPVEEIKAPRRRFPSLVIPSPNRWPTVQKLQKKGASPTPILSPGLLSPNHYLSPTPEALARLASHTMQKPSSNAPSLDGSFTSDELSHQSCPSTPDMEHRNEASEDWSAPAQLHPNAMETLVCLTGVSSNSDSQMFGIPSAEMQEIGSPFESNNVDILITPVGTDDGSLSLLSIPSPGGFFSALEPSSRHTWLPSPVEEAPSTSIAERFYSVPWRDATSRDNPVYRSDQASPTKHQPVVEKTVFIPGYYDDDENLTEGPPTARRIPLTSPKGQFDDIQVRNQAGPPSTQGSRTISLNSIDSFPTAVASDQSEYKETYDAELKANSKTNLDRTTLWLDQQNVFLEEVLEDKLQSPRDRSNSDPDSILSSSDKTSNTDASHKSVRFADDQQIGSSSSKPASPASPKDSTFVRGFQHLSTHTQKTDAFIHRATRNDALRLDRRCLFSSHVDHLEGKYNLESPSRVAPMRPVSHFNIGVQEEEAPEKAIFADVQREQRVLEQIKPVSWNLEATKMLNGGTLLMSPTGKTFSKTRQCRVLDLGGQATCDWAWQVAIEHSNATVHTVYTGEQLVDHSIEGPENHMSIAVPNLWTLPFPNSHFHLVSARNLYAHLKTFRPNGFSADEYDLTLKECMRVLKPGGCLEFTLLDADILRPGPMGSALSVEFCYNLKTRGYDPAPTKNWLPRLRKAGFGQVRRAWLILPMAQQGDAEREARAGLFVNNEAGTTADASLISGMVGSWAWERWMLRLHREMGRDEERLLDGVQATIEEGATTGASWRYLSGWARKPLKVG